MTRDPALEARLERALVREGGGVPFWAAGDPGRRRGAADAPLDPAAGPLRPRPAAARRAA